MQNIVQALRKGVGIASRIISIIAFVCVLVVSFLMLKNAFETNRTQQLQTTLSSVRKTSQDAGSTDWSNGMLAINKDYAGWLTVYGTQASGPVLLGETNDTYLRTDIYGNHSEAGTFFLDETTNLEKDGNLIIYGHKMNDGTMFGTLDSFKEEEFFKENKLVCWEGERGKEYYEIFALMIVPGYAYSADFINLPDWNNVLSVDNARAMLDTIYDRALISRNETFDLEKDRFMFLVTCDYDINNGRMVLAARRLDKAVT